MLQRLARLDRPAGNLSAGNTPLSVMASIRYMPLTASKSAFSTTTKHPRPRLAIPKEETKQIYEERVAATSEDYFHRYTFDLSLSFSKWIRNHMKSKYLEPELIQTRRYFEVGPGEGASVLSYGPYFDELLMLEPNPLFRDSVTQRLNAVRFNRPFRYIPKVLSDFEVGIDLAANEHAEGFDLMVIGHVMRHVSTDAYHLKLNELYDLLAPGGIMLLSSFLEEGPFYECHTKYVPHIQFAQRIYDHFDVKPLKGKEFSLEMLRDESVHYDMSAVEAVDTLRFHIPGNVAVQIGDIRGDADLESNIRSVLAENECLSLNPETGEEWAHFPSPQGHVILHKFAK